VAGLHTGGDGTLRGTVTRVIILGAAGGVARVAEASGQPFSFHVLAEPTLHQRLEGAVLPAPAGGVILSIQEKFVHGRFDIVTGDVERLAERKPRSLRELLAGAF
jgi:NAD(P)H dehydrogenase (quinone)